jgi:uncharacterized lipoprotein YmbA
LVVTILALRARPEGTVTMTVGWSLLAPDPSRTIAGQHLQLSAEAGPGSTGQAQAISAILGQLADRVVGDLTSSSASDGRAMEDADTGFLRGRSKNTPARLAP